jgi:AcrR family transcriptional regulator
MGKREQILQATVMTIGGKGYTGLTMSTIAAQADIGKSTLYEYFDSKDNLVMEATVYFATEFLNRVYDHSWDAGNSYETVLKAGIRATIEMLKPELNEHNSFFNNMMTIGYHENMKNEYMFAMKPVFDLSINYTRRVLALGQEEGILKAEINDIEIAIAQRLMSVMVVTFLENGMLTDILSHLSNEEIIEYIYTYMTKTLQ